MYKLVIDLEMNNAVKVYSDKVESNNIREIIEIGAILLDNENNEIDRFQTYVKPSLAEIHKRITKITGITNEMVENAPDIIKAFEMISKFINKYTDADNIVICTWSNNDTYAISKEIEVKGLFDESLLRLVDNFVDIQQIFNSRINFDNRVNLSKALELIGEDFEGTAHGALADAINTARIYKYMQSDEKVNNLLNEINKTMACEELTSSIGSMIDFSKFKFE